MPSFLLNSKLLVLLGRQIASIPGWVLNLASLGTGLGAALLAVHGYRTPWFQDRLPWLLHETHLEQACITYLDECKPLPAHEPRAEVVASPGGHATSWLPERVAHYHRRGRLHCARPDRPCVGAYKARHGASMPLEAFIEELCHANVDTLADGQTCDEPVGDARWNVPLKCGSVEVRRKRSAVIVAVKAPSEADTEQCTPPPTLAPEASTAPAPKTNVTNDDANDTAEVSPRSAP